MPEPVRPPSTVPIEPTPGLDRRLAAVTLRARVQRGIVALPPLATGLGAGLVCVFLARDLGALSQRDAMAAALVASIVAILAVVVAALRPLEPLTIAVMLDRALSLRGRLANALSLARERDPMAVLARRDAERHADRIDPARVLPLRWPRSILGAILTLGAALVLLGLGPFTPHVAPTPIADDGPRLAVAEAPAAVDPDALDALRERMAETRRERELTAEAQASTDALNALIEELATGELTEDEALARIAELEASLDRSALTRSAEIQRELSEAARQMRARDTEALTRALSDGQLDDAAHEMQEIARRAREEAPSRELIEDLRAMAEDRERRARERELEQAEEEEERLLERRREREARGEEPPEEEERLLEQRQRELDQLRREHEARQEVERQLDQLRRELGDAADRMQQEHRRPSEGGSEAMERAAEQMQQHAREQQSAEQMQELARELQRLREALREAQQQGDQGQGGQGGQQEGQDGQQGGQGARMRRFTLRAGGGDQEGGVSLGVRRPGGQGGQGGEQEGQGGQGGQQPGQGQPGAGGDQPGGEGQGGQGQEGEMLVLGQGGDAVLEIPGMGQGGAGRGTPQGGGEGQGEGGGQGSGHDGTSLDDPTGRLAGGRQVQVSGQPGEGPSRSQVIRGASSRGFASRDYERVYEDYASHADEAVERDRVPPGRRGYVERYFELIRPRTTTSSGASAGTTEDP